MNASQNTDVLNSASAAPPKAKKKKKWGRWLLLVAVLAAGTIGITARGGDTSAPLDKTQIAQVKRQDLLLEVVDTGTIAAKDKADIKSKVSGQVLDVFVDEGELVKKGQLLLRLDASDYAREVARTEAELAQGKQAASFAELVLKRKQSALADRAIAAAEVELAQNDVDMKLASVRIAEVAVAAARDRLRACDIKSPLDGTVVLRGVEPGEVVTAGVTATVDGKPLITIADLSTLLVTTELNQIDVARVQLQHAVTLTLDALPGETFQAVVTKIAPASVKSESRGTQVFPIEATLTATSSNIKSGMTADVRIAVGSLPGVLVLPIEAIVHEGDEQFVKAIVVGKDGTKRAGDKTRIKLGKSNDHLIEVKEGVAEGAEVAIDPAKSDTVRSL